VELQCDFQEWSHWENVYWTTDGEKLGHGSISNQWYPQLLVIDQEGWTSNKSYLIESYHLIKKHQTMQCKCVFCRHILLQYYWWWAFVALQVPWSRMVCHWEDVYWTTGRAKTWAQIDLKSVGCGYHAQLPAIGQESWTLWKSYRIESLSTDNAALGTCNAEKIFVGTFFW